MSFLVDAQVIAMLGPDASAADIMRELDKRRSEDAELSERGTQQAQARDPLTLDFTPYTNKNFVCCYVYPHL
jgi:lysine/ornithine N-monooxygenase